MVNALLATVATLLYLGGMAGALVYLSARPAALVYRVATGFLLGGFLLHAALLARLSLGLGQLPVSTLQQALSFFAWVVVGAYLLVQLRFNLRIFGAFVTPLAVGMMLLAGSAPGYALPGRVFVPNFWVALHVGTMFLGNGLFALAFCAGVMYLLQEHNIKQKRFGFWYRRLPSLQTLDQLNHLCITAGFPLISVGLVAGFGSAAAIWRSVWHWDPKEIFSLCTWLIYAVLFHERLAVGWRGRRAAIMAIVGFTAVLVTFLGVGLLFQSHHRFVLD